AVDDSHGLAHHSVSDFWYAHGFRFSLTPLPRFFSPFPHGTGSLSVAREYLALADGPACFPRGSTCPAVLGIRPGESTLSATGLLPPMAGLSRPLRLECSFVTPSWDVPQPRKASLPVWAPPRSLAATCGITVVFFSSGY